MMTSNSKRARKMAEKIGSSSIGDVEHWETIILSALDEAVKAELETANKRIAELEKDNERLQKALDKADPQGIYDDKKTTGGG